MVIRVLAVTSLGASTGGALAQGSVETDRAALVALYNATGGPNWTNSTNWLSDEPLSEWFGVTTDANGGVVERLRLGGWENDEPISNRLTWSIPPALGNLDRLRILNLCDLWSLTLGSNALSGPRPAALGNLANLWSLLLARNALSGAILHAAAHGKEVVEQLLAAGAYGPRVTRRLGQKAATWSGWEAVVFVTVITFVGSALQGVIGFGLGPIVTPFLILLSPELVPAPILVCTMVLTLLMAYRERAAIDVRGIKWAMLGRIAGTVVAGGVLAFVTADTLVLLFGLFILAAVAMSMSGLRFEPTDRVLVTAGVASGILGTLAAVGGAPLALLYKDAPGARIRSTLSGFFLIGTIMSLAALWVVGRFGVGELRLALLMLPGMLAGFALSRQIAPYFDRGYTRPVILTVVALIGAVIVIRQLVYRETRGLSSLPAG